MLAQQQLQADYEKVRTEDSEKSNKLQELMSVDHINFKQKRSVLSLLASPPTPLPVNWVEFMPYKDEKIDNNCKKSEKNLYNSQLAKGARGHYTMSIFHVHAFHLQLFISLTLILVTHKCPNYVIILD